MIEFVYHTDEPDEGILAGMRRAFEAALSTEGVGACDMTVLLTGEDEIQTLNRNMRGIDRVTDVLSFPSIRYPEGRTARDCPKRLARHTEPSTGRPFLGDAAICVPRAREQAAEYGHSLARETAFLTAHAALHLMGYDHIAEDDRRVMRQREDEVMAETGIYRDEELLEKAVKAMEGSYSPYSHFRVGACILTSGGKVFTGANIENASFGATICAERAALCAAVSAGERRFTTIAIAGDVAAWPCGICRQALWEFADHLRVIVGTKDGIAETTTLEALLPHGFGGEDMRK